MKQKQSHTESTKVGRGWGKDVKNFLTIDLKSFLKLAEIDCLLYTNRPKSPKNTNSNCAHSSAHKQRQVLAIPHAHTHTHTHRHAHHTHTHTHSHTHTHTHSHTHTHTQLDTHTHTHMDGANGKAGENGAASMKRK